METDPRKLLLLVGFLFLISLSGSANGFTDPNDLKVLLDFKKHLLNPDLLKWPDDGDPCGPPPWARLSCSNGRVTQIDLQNLGLEGPLPNNLNHLDKLQNIAFQRNKFTGPIPTLRDLSDLEFAYLNFNAFDTIPSDFFRGLTAIRVLALDSNPLNRTEQGWALPTDLAESTQLVNLSCMSTNLIGPLPDFLGTLPSLASLKLSYNSLSGIIPPTFRDSMLQELWLNDQENEGLSGGIGIVGSMHSLTSLWLHGNSFNGPIPDDIGSLTSLTELDLNQNRLVGLIPPALAEMNLQNLDLNNNMLMGSIPDFKAEIVTYEDNSFCQTHPGEKCAPEVTALLDFLKDLNYPETLASSWKGNDPCSGPWQGITCNSMKEVSVINLQRLGLNGTLGPSLARLPSLMEIHLESNNNLHGPIPENLTRLPSLRVLNLKDNKFAPPYPKFRPSVKVVTDGNPKFQSPPPPASAPSPPNGSDSPPRGRPSPAGQDRRPDTPNSSSNSTRAVIRPNLENSKRRTLVAAAVGGFVISFALLAALVFFCCRSRRKTKKTPPARVASYPKDPSDSVKTAFIPSKFESELGSSLVSLHVLRLATGDFSKENELGRGGFGVVYRGELEDGTQLAVKRMVVGAMCNTALDEFRSEIGVLSKVRHRHLVSLLGYSAEGDERLLVYEYMPQGALSRHLFQWKSSGLEPLSWTRRLCIALDVARGVEYLHTLAHQSFIHRDLKSANILLDDEFRAKVADFGLVKLAPDRQMSVATRLAGTFGYLAPEYAVTGKITTKVDVFSFGVVLMELLTGMVALDEQRPEETRYLAEWFWRVKSNKESLIASVDSALDAKEDIYETIYAMAALAGHCTARDPNHRPEMGHAVNVLGQLVEKWRPHEEAEEDLTDMSLPLPQMLKGWQEEEGGSSRNFSYASLDSKGSIPARPSGFGDSFKSNDGR